MKIRENVPIFNSLFTVSLMGQNLDFGSEVIA